jgi:hypothetical protein
LNELLGRTPTGCVTSVLLKNHERTCRDWAVQIKDQRLCAKTGRRVARNARRFLNGQGDLVRGEQDLRHGRTVAAVHNCGDLSPNKVPGSRKFDGAVGVCLLVALGPSSKAKFACGRLGSGGFPCERTNQVPTARALAVTSDKNSTALGLMLRIAKVLPVRPNT